TGLISANISLFTAIEILLFRKKGYIVPFWKTPDIYVEFAEAVLKADGEPEAPDPAAKFNLLLSQKYKQIVATNRGKIDAGTLRRTSDNVDFHSHEFCRALERAVNGSLSIGCGAVRAYYLAKFKPAPEGMQLISGGKRRPLGVLSPSIPALEAAWQSLPHLWI